MSTRSEVHVVIVDPQNYGGLALHSALAESGAVAHVVKTFEAATQLIENSHIDAAVVEFSNDKKTTAFLKALAERHIAVVYTSEPPEASADPRNAQRSIVTALAAALARRRQKD